MLSSNDIRKFARALAEVVADEAERNPEFAKRLLRALEPLNPSSPARRDVPDPFSVFADRGATEFRRWLDGLRLEDLRAITRAHRLDSSRLSDKWKSKDRFVALVAERVEARAKQGDVFRHYGAKEGARAESAEPQSQVGTERVDAPASQSRAQNPGSTIAQTDSPEAESEAIARNERPRQ